jgi:hypothetical protein
LYRFHALRPTDSLNHRLAFQLMDSAALAPRPLTKSTLAAQTAASTTLALPPIAFTPLLRPLGPQPLSSKKDRSHFCSPRTDDKDCF